MKIGTVLRIISTVCFLLIAIITLIKMMTVPELGAVLKEILFIKIVVCLLIVDKALSEKD